MLKKLDKIANSISLFSDLKRRIVLGLLKYYFSLDCVILKYWFLLVQFAWLW